MSKYLLIIAIVVIAGWVLFFPFEDDSSKSKSIVIASRLWSPPSEQEFLRKEILAKFEKEHQCKVHLKILNDDALFKQVLFQQETQNINTNIVVVYGSKMNEWLRKKMLENLTSHVATWNDRSFVKSFSKLMKDNDAQYFLPLAADDYLLCANTKAFKYLPEGSDFNQMKWTELLTWCQNITKGEGSGKFALSVVQQKMLIYQCAALMLSYGASFPDVSSQAALNGWKLWQKFGPTLSPTVKSYDSVVSPMKRGEAWVTVTHNARVSEILASAPANFKIAPPPSGPAGIGSIAGINGIGLVRGTKNKELSIELIKYLTSPAAQSKLSQGGFIPTVSEARDLLGNRPKDTVIRHSLHVLEKGQLAYIPKSKDWGKVKQVYDEAFDRIVLEQAAIDSELLSKKQAIIDALVQP